MISVSAVLYYLCMSMKIEEYLLLLVALLALSIAPIFSKLRNSLLVPLNCKFLPQYQALESSTTIIKVARNNKTKKFILNCWILYCTFTLQNWSFIPCYRRSISISCVQRIVVTKWKFYKFRFFISRKWIINFYTQLLQNLENRTKIEAIFKKV